MTLRPSISSVFRRLRTFVSLTIMRLLVTCEHRFSMAPDGSVWTKVAFEYSFWERYLKVFDVVRIVARASDGVKINNSHKRVTGNGVEFWPVPFYLGPEQFLMKRRKIRAALHGAVEKSDARAAFSVAASTDRYGIIPPIG